MIYDTINPVPRPPRAVAKPTCSLNGSGVEVITPSGSFSVFGRWRSSGRRIIPHYTQWQAQKNLGPYHHYLNVLKSFYVDFASFFDNLSIDIS